ncbi:uncharacterized protein METZ01_LOCUS313548, partial [marine metagenome]
PHVGGHWTLRPRRDFPDRTHSGGRASGRQGERVDPGADRPRPLVGRPRRVDGRWSRTQRRDHSDALQRLGDRGPSRHGGAQRRGWPSGGRHRRRHCRRAGASHGGHSRWFGCRGVGFHHRM